MRRFLHDKQSIIACSKTVWSDPFITVCSTEEVCHSLLHTTRGQLSGVGMCVGWVGIRVTSVKLLCMWSLYVLSILAGLSAE